LVGDGRAFGARRRAWRALAPTATANLEWERRRRPTRPSQSRDARVIFISMIFMTATYRY
jgi:hypothetical protein